MKKLGFGFMRLPLLDNSDRTSVDYDLLFNMVDAFIDNGFSYFDTAYAYHNGVSETAIRKAVVERYDRDKILIADKMPMFMIKKKEQLNAIFCEQLERCGVTYFDYYLLHAVGHVNYPIIKEIDAIDFLREKQKKGYIKHIGISFHDKAELLEEILINYPEIEVVQLQINYIDWDDPMIEAGKCYEVASKYGKDIIVMEPIKGGVLANVPNEVEKIFKEYDSKSSAASWALRFVASKPKVVMILSGMSELEQVEDNVKIINEFKPLNKEELNIIENAKNMILATIAIPCTSCHYCTKNCPVGIKIPEYFAIYNNWKKFINSQKVVASMYFSNILKSSGSVSECIECKRCEKVCPQHIEVSKKLKEVYSELSRQSLLSIRSFCKKNANLRNKKDDLIN